MNDAGLPPVIAQAIRARFDIASSTRIKPGMSGALVFRCVSRSGEIYALKRWPSTAQRSRIEEVHRVVAFCRNSGCDVLPGIHLINGADTIESADGCWELADWMPGETLQANAPLESAAAGAAAIASFHAAAEKLTTGQLTTGLGRATQTPPAVLDRLRRVTELDALLMSALRVDPTDRVSPRLADAVRNAQSILRQNWRGAADQISRAMNQYINRPLPTQYVLRDVHRDHILFDEGRVSGLIDFDAIRCDTPAIDLARWTGSLLAGRSDVDLLWDTVLAGFQRGSSSHQHHNADQVIQLAKELHFATSWISLANWVVWLLVECRRFPAGEDAVAERILEWIQLSAQEA